MSKPIIGVAALIFATLSLQACVYASSQTTPQPASQNQPAGTVCDANGNNCQPCDASNPNCQATATKKSWGFFF
jgi:hypothetical protein